MIGFIAIQRSPAYWVTGLWGYEVIAPLNPQGRTPIRLSPRGGDHFVPYKARIKY